jgi:hypothetical protein
MKYNSIVSGKVDPEYYKLTIRRYLEVNGLFWTFYNMIRGYYGIIFNKELNKPLLLGIFFSIMKPLLKAS